MSIVTVRNVWPELKWANWSKTADTLHMWTQIVGKTRLALSPLQAHWWNVPLYVNARGLSTSAMPYGKELLEIEFDFVSHDLRFRVSNGAILSTPLRAQSVAEFFSEYQRSLAAIGVAVKIHPVPVEIKDPIPFAEDTQHADYDCESANRFWRALVRSDQIFQQFSSGFLGKINPVHFFWGSFDLAVTRFSGRPAAPRAGADSITREAYSHEVISAARLCKLQYRAGRIPSEIRRSPRRGVPGCRPHRLSANFLRRSGEFGWLGSEFAGARISDHLSASAPDAAGRL